MDIFTTNYQFEFGDTSEDEGGGLGPIHLRHLGVLVVLDGVIDVQVDERRFRVDAGQAGFLYAHKVHKLIYSEHEFTRYIWCGGGFTPGRDFLATKEATTQLDAVPCTLKPSSTLYRLLSTGISLRSRDGVAAQRLRDTLGGSVFNEYFYLANMAEEDNELHRSVVAAKRYIMKSYIDPDCDLTKIADASSMTPQHLTKLFKHHLSCTPIKFLWKLRSEEALHLLKYSRLQNAQIAAECGFRDPYHFSRYIKKQYGLPPKEIRKRHWDLSEN